MQKLVTIGIPVYRRLEYLPGVLRSVEAQDYPALELLVSDNGRNGTKVEELVRQHYKRPFRFRQNAETVSGGRHFNQLIDAAAGEYTAILSDDDEISENYVSKLVEALELHPAAGLALSRQEIMNEAGVVIRNGAEVLPRVQAGDDFMNSIWRTYEFRFECLATFLAKTGDMRRCGGYGDFPSGAHNENALVIKLALGRQVALSSDCVFRWRVAASSYGGSSTIRDLAEATRAFITFLDTDPYIVASDASRNEPWQATKDHLVEMAWATYLRRWRDVYWEQLSLAEWTKAAFAMPLYGAYYRAALIALSLRYASVLKHGVGRLFESGIAV